MPDEAPQGSRSYCPTCEPEVDASERYVHPVFCSAHTPDSSGVVDHVVTAASYLSGTNEAGGEENRRWCELIHRDRDKVLTRRPK